jgi:hypothetical protein
MNAMPSDILRHRHIRWFGEIGIEDAAAVGGRGKMA